MTKRTRTGVGGPARALAAAALVSMALHLFALARGATAAAYVFEPTTTLLVIGSAVAWWRQDARAAGGARRKAVPLAPLLAGLLASLVGDVLLMVPGDRFVSGLVAFLVAHLCYVAAFAAGRPAARPSRALAAAYAALLVMLLAWLLPHTGALAPAVAVYGAALAAMAWQAAERWRVVRTRGAGLAAMGGALFVVSDAALAGGRFVGSWPGREIVVMVTYVVAQLLIARSAAE